MSSMPASSVLNAKTETYPLLTVAQIDRLRSFARLRNVERGEVLYHPGDVAVPLDLMLSACVEIKE
jgi:thioredoxin reductase (NADPH)